MKLPVISGKEILKVLSNIGYYIRDQKGSHVHVRHPWRKPLTVPMHDELD
ncbi:MAG: type II toxin-antitoxin system HicA family toxin [Candidatus Aenigmarchaeota archaeon]|nr:type II toxin-antitoxin system HicA family toxin [Candidatus Aenigmarchaeota archaeon]